MEEQKKKVQVLKSKQIIDATGADPIEKGILVIEDKKIKQIGTEPDIQIPADAEVIDLSSYRRERGW